MGHSKESIMSLRGRDILFDLAACKAAGICARDKLVTENIANRVNNHKHRTALINEIYRKASYTTKYIIKHPKIG